MTDLQNLSFPLEYYCDEVREGFFVSETMKRFWAAQLVVLAEVDKICKRHNLNWYAEGGTLLGAVRHKGYIPWDDDLDIVMFRDDYKKFLEYARKELPEGYIILSPEDKKFDNPFGRIVNGSEVRYSPEHLSKFHGCQYLVGVDIYQFDNIFKDIDKEEERLTRGALVISTLCGIRDETLSEDEIRERIAKIEKDNNTTINMEHPKDDLTDLFVKIAQESDDDADEIAIMDVWIGESRCVYYRSCYEKWVDLPFETTALRAPYMYKKVLHGCFGDNYMKPIRGGALHGYPLYREQENTYREATGTDPGRYYFKKDSFIPKGEKKSFWAKQKEMLISLRSVHDNTQNIVAAHGIEAAVQFLEACQSAAVAIGNIIEGRYGEEIAVVKALEDYCEVVYEASVGWNDDSKEKLDESLRIVEKQIEEQEESSQKEILFLLCKVSWWDSIKDVYSSSIRNERNNVSVLAIPYSFLDNAGNVIGIQTDFEEFKKIPVISGRLVNLSDYNIERRHPDKIIIQFPYDGTSGALAVPQEFYSDRMSEFTDELVFVPHLTPDAPESTEDAAYAAMQELVEQPAIFNADKILIGSDKLREYYVKKLVDMTDESLKDYWDKRICLKNELFD